MTPAERKLYNRLCKIQGHLFKLIGNIESIKIAMASDYAIPPTHNRQN